MKTETKTGMRTMRDVFIEQIYNRMHKDGNIFFLSADFGSPKLDKLREDFKDRFINVGIAEQNLINVSTGLALEGFTVYAYTIAPFLTMRAYEQIRNNLSLLSQVKKINVNLVGVGAGLSYDVSGPTHHCLEDISIMCTLPNMMVFSPSDTVLTCAFVDYSLKIKKPKYLRLDGKPLLQIYKNPKVVRLEDGFYELRVGKNVCLVSTGFMTHRAIEVADLLERDGIRVGLIDIFMLRPLSNDLLYRYLKKYQFIFTLEEGFKNTGSLGSSISDIITERKTNIRLNKLGFLDRYVFDVGNRGYLHSLNKLDADAIAENIRSTFG